MNKLHKTEKVQLIEQVPRGLWIAEKLRMVLYMRLLIACVILHMKG